MPINTQLGDLVTMLRNEIGASTDPTQGLNQLPALQHLIQRTQQMLYDDFTWKHMLADIDVDLVAGQRYYSFPPEINFDLIYGAWVNFTGSTWQPIQYGIDPTFYNYSNPEVEGNRSSPCSHWNHYDTNSFEVWPVPDSNTTQKIRFRCTRNLRPLLANADECDIDDILITMFAASELLLRQKAPDASAKQQLAQKRYATLKGKQLKKDIVPLGRNNRRRGFNHNYQIRIQGS